MTNIWCQPLTWANKIKICQTNRLRGTQQKAAATLSSGVSTPVALIASLVAILK